MTFSPDFSTYIGSNTADVPKVQYIAWATAVQSRFNSLEDALSTSPFTRVAVSGNLTINNATHKGKILTCTANAYNTISLAAPGGFDTIWQCIVTNESATRSKQISISGLSTFDLFPGQQCWIFRSGGQWQVVRDKRWVLSAPLDIFIDVGAADDSQDGFASGTGNAKKTLSAAILWANVYLDAAYQQIRFRLANGTYTESVRTLPIMGANPGGWDTNAIQILGDTTTPSNVLFNTAAGPTFWAVNNTYGYKIDGVKMVNTTGNQLVYSHFRSLIYLGKNEYGACPGAALHANLSGGIEIVDNYTINGNQGLHTYSDFCSNILSVAGKTVTLSGTPAFSICYAYATRNGVILAQGQTYSGAATGPRFIVDTGGKIDTAGAGGTYFPGNAAGTATSPGEYM